MIVALAVLLILPNAPKNGNGGGGKTYTMTFMEMVYDWDYSTYGFKSMQPGDTLIIKDTIRRIAAYYGNTYIEFVGGTVAIRGDITSSYSTYDRVSITLTIITITDSYSGYQYEWFKEDLDGLPGEIILPMSVISHA